MAGWPQTRMTRRTFGRLPRLASGAAWYGGVIEATSVVGSSSLFLHLSCLFRIHPSIASDQLASGLSFCVFILGIARPFFLNSYFRLSRYIHSSTLPPYWHRHSLSPQQLVLMLHQNLTWLSTG